MGFWKKRVARRQSRPGIEALEGRAVPATFHVANVAQLQADIAAVSNTSGPNTIVLAPGDYDLTGELQVQNASDLTIRGSRTSKGTINIVGGFGNRVFEIDGGNVTISDVKVSGGGDCHARRRHLRPERQSDRREQHDHRQLGDANGRRHLRPRRHAGPSRAARSPRTRPVAEPTPSAAASPPRTPR